MRQLRFKDYLVVVGGILLIALSISFAHVNQVGGAGSAPVTVVNTPLPVQGNTSVSGTVSATQSGAWSVGVNNFPSTLTGATPLPVSGTVTANVSLPDPLPVQSVNSASSSVALECVSPSPFNLCTPAQFFQLNNDGTTQGSPYSIPAGQVLVITDVEWQIFGGNNTAAVAFFVGTQVVENCTQGCPGPLSLEAPYLYVSGGSGSLARADHFTTGFVTTQVPYASAPCTRRRVGDRRRDPARVHELAVAAAIASVASTVAPERATASATGKPGAQTAATPHYGRRTT